MKTITLQSGVEVPLSLNFGMLYILRSERKDVYEKYQYANNHMSDPNEDRIFMITDIIYAAYLCGAIKEKTLDSAYDYQKFLEELPEDFVSVSKIVTELINPKKMKASDILSN